MFATKRYKHVLMVIVLWGTIGLICMSVFDGTWDPVWKWFCAYFLITTAMDVERMLATVKCGVYVHTFDMFDNNDYRAERIETLTAASKRWEML